MKRGEKRRTQEPIAVGPGDAVKDLVVKLEFTNWKGDPQTIKIKYLTCFGPKLDGGDAVAIDFLDKVTYVQPGMIIIEGFNNPSTA